MQKEANQVWANISPSRFGESRHGDGYAAYVDPYGEIGFVGGGSGYLGCKFDLALQIGPQAQHVNIGFHKGNDTLGHFNEAGNIVSFNYSSYKNDRNSLGQKGNIAHELQHWNFSKLGRQKEAITQYLVNNLGEIALLQFAAVLIDQSQLYVSSLQNEFLLFPQFAQFQRNILINGVYPYSINLVSVVNELLAYATNYYYIHGSSKRRVRAFFDDFTHITHYPYASEVAANMLDVVKDQEDFALLIENSVLADVLKGKNSVENNVQQVSNALEELDRSLKRSRR